MTNLRSLQRHVTSEQDGWINIPMSGSCFHQRYGYILKEADRQCVQAWESSKSTETLKLRLEYLMTPSLT